MTAPDQAFYDFEFTYSNRGIHTFIMLNNLRPLLDSNPSHEEKCRFAELSLSATLG